VLLALAGARADDPAWHDSLDAMVAYAGQHGWLNAAGDVRAHIDPA
jgi:hypothetical protein